MTLEELQNSIYDNSLFCRFTKELQLTEKQIQTEKLEKVTFESAGEFIQIQKNLFEKRIEIYKPASNKNRNQKQTDKTCSRKTDEMLSFRNSCDGVFFLNTERKSYLIFVELKSGYREVTEKGIYQLVATYIKTKQLLHSYATYDESKYEELGLIVSYPFPENELDSANNEQVFALKQSQIRVSSTRDYRLELIRKKEVVMKGEDFGLNEMNISPAITMKALRVKHLKVENEKCECKFDLDAIVQG